jgi:hypothetical protein
MPADAPRVTPDERVAQLQARFHAIGRQRLRL